MKMQVYRHFVFFLFLRPAILETQLEQVKEFSFTVVFVKYTQIQLCCCAILESWCEPQTLLV